MNKKFVVLEDFIIRREHDRCVLDDPKKPNNAPILGMYWQGHEYAVTDVNEPAIKEAIAKKVAVITGVTL